MNLQLKSTTFIALESYYGSSQLSTLQQPWGAMNLMQVVGAVSFQHRRLDILDDMDPAIADINKQCWQTDAKSRPTFAEIMAVLKPLLKPIIASAETR
ncbi:putative serine/threonine-protein kinase sis8 [Stylosanthes scabra]|uniref:Serine/threonine-protein kinase sis8 n=1 Tax=Stylosanthes scabra TaxID=79078 RepID=A0ABU6Z8A8_9FABA|nr:putative serine/threonine-protein kinase sis8 [Stylosanthes scabra]